VTASTRRIVIAAVVGAAIVAWALWKVTSVPLPGGPALVTRVQQLNQLATVRYTVQKIVELTDNKYPVGSESILLIVQARVEAGVDLAGMHSDDVKVHSGTVTVRLPDARILNAFIDEKQTKVWDRTKTWWTPWVPYSLDLEQRARIAGLEAAKRSAIEDGILTQAETNAQTSIRQLLLLAGAKEVRFVHSSLT